MLATGKAGIECGSTERQLDCNVGRYDRLAATASTCKQVHVCCVCCVLCICCVSCVCFVCCVCGG